MRYLSGSKTLNFSAENTYKISYDIENTITFCIFGSSYNKLNRLHTTISLLD